MTEENDAVEGTITQFKIESPEGTTIRDSETLTLTLSGDAFVIAAAAEVLMTFLQTAFGGTVVGMRDSDGNDLTPPTLDPLSTGDESVA